MLNLCELIRRFGSIKEIYESEREKYIRYLKNEMTTMHLGDNFLSTVMSNLMQTLCLQSTNKGNKYHSGETYERAVNFKSYASVIEVKKNYLEQGKLLSGVVLPSDNGSDIYVCIRKRRANNTSTYVLYKVFFIDNSGVMKWNLWYAPIQIEAIASISFPSVEDLHKAISDFVIIHPMPTSEGGYKAINGHTVLARSWRVRTEFGQLSVPVPCKEIFDEN